MSDALHNDKNRLMNLQDLTSTPRTDAHATVTYYAILLDGRREAVDVVPVAYARQLEQELNEANYALAEISDTWKELWPTWDEHSHWSMSGCLSRFTRVIEQARRMMRRASTTGERG